jgi:hypothetical protein
MSALLIGGIAAAFAGAVLIGELAAQRPDCCEGMHPVAAIYGGKLNRMERLLVTGDGQVFAALAQDPLLSRPEVFGSRSELSYRAQRPALGYATWIASLGQRDGVGAALLIFAVLGCGAAAAVGALLLADRGVSPYWSLAIVVAGLESITELTPELAAFALFGAGLRMWTRDKRLAGILLFVLSIATRETMLVGVVGLAVWELAQFRAQPRRPSRAALLMVPCAYYAAWALILRLRTGAFPTEAGGARTGVPGAGIATALRTSSSADIIVIGCVLAVALCIAGWVLARRDPLTWIATAYLAFAPTMAPVVWEVHAAFSRVLFPLYAFAVIAAAGGLAARRRATLTSLINEPSGDAEQRREEPAGVALRRLRHVFR